MLATGTPERYVARRERLRGDGEKALVREGDAAARHRRRLDDRRGRLTQRHEPVDDLLQVLDVSQVGGHHAAVVAGHAPAVDHLWRLPGELRDVCELAGRRADPDDGAE